MKARTTLTIVTAATGEYQPARTRPEPIIDEWEPISSRYDDTVLVPIAPNNHEIGDNEFTGVVIKNMDETNFITATWKNDDASTGACQIPAGRTLVLPWVNGGGVTPLILVADTAICNVRIFATL